MVVVVIVLSYNVILCASCVVCFLVSVLFREERSVLPSYVGLAWMLVHLASQYGVSLPV